MSASDGSGSLQHYQLSVKREVIERRRIVILPNRRNAMMTTTTTAQMNPECENEYGVGFRDRNLKHRTGESVSSLLARRIQDILLRRPRLSILQRGDTRRTECSHSIQ